MTQATTNEMAQAVKNMTLDTGKYLTFVLEKETYGIRILKVKEIIGMMSVTSVPRTPEFVKGVVNLRGKVIPVIDIRRKFAMGDTETTDRTCIIVAEIESRDGTVQTGMVVDEVSEVLNIDEADIEAAPDFGTRLDTEYILGIAKSEGGVKILLNIDKVLSSDEIAKMDQIS